MTPIQQLMLGVGAKKKVYMDDVFSTYLWNGNGADRTITNGIDLKAEGGMVWVKQRNSAQDHIIGDTARDDPSLTGQKFLSSNDNGAQTSDTNGIKYFYNTGFSTGSGGHVNSTGNTYSSWSFRKAKGFFDIVTYTGNAAGRWIPHNLGCKPGLILFKRYDQAENWVVYHRSPGATHYMHLDGSMGTGQANANSGFFLDTEPTATHFRVGTQTGVNGPGYEMIAYVFAGGDSGAATASSTEFTGSTYLTVPDASNDLDFQGGDRTIEMWINPDDWGSGDKYLWSSGSQSLSIFKESGGGFKIGRGSANYYTHPELPPVKQWTHIALVRTNNKLYLYFNGTLVKGDISVSHFYGGTRYVGTNYNSTSSGFDGKISNLRFTKSAVYTSSFKPPTEPLTNISNTELLMCNSSSSATASTVTTGTITSSGGVNPKSDSPFYDPAGFVFGEEGDEGVIKCGSYEGSGTAGNNEIFLGFEPQYILIKRTDGTGNWRLFDSMRGVVSDGNDPYLQPNWDSLESTSSEVLDLTPTGFRLQTTDNNINGGGLSYAYMAIRRPDGYCGKPIEDATKCFAMDTGAGSSTIPNFDSGFPVDWAMSKKVSANQNWFAGARLIQGKYLGPNTNSAESGSSAYAFDSNVGWQASSNVGVSYQSWMWKRHAGFDVVTTGPGKGSGEVIRHNLGRTPEMIWAKKRATSNWPGNSNDNYVLDNWFVWHKDAHASAVAGYLNTNGASGLNMVYTGEVNSVGAKFHSNITYTDDENLMLFFASVDGISKVGSYTGNGASSQTITTGFQPRFIIIKNIDQSGKSWMVLDTVRGWASGNDNYLQLNDSAAQLSHDFGNPTSTGFYLHGGGSTYNGSGTNYIYYAHA